MATERERLFGNDLRLVERTGGLDFIGASGDLDLAEGVPNISQALKLRLQVRRGELTPLGWPNFGSRIHEMIGEPNNERTRTILMAYARSAIEQDPRVAQVVDVRATPDRNEVRIEMDILLINEPNPINLVLPVNLEPT